MQNPTGQLHRAVLSTLNASAHTVGYILALATGCTSDRTTAFDRVSKDLQTLLYSRQYEHLDALVACDLAHVAADGSVRATTTGEELLALDTDVVIAVDPPGRDDGPDA